MEGKTDKLTFELSERKSTEPDKNQKRLKNKGGFAPRLETGRIWPFDTRSVKKPST